MTASGSGLVITADDPASHVWFYPNGYLLGNFQTVSFQSNHLFGIVGEQADGFQAKIHKNLRAQAIFPQVHAVTKLEIGFHRVQTLLLQFIGLDFGGQANATAFLPHVKNHPAPGFSHLPHGLMQLRAAIASA